MRYIISWAASLPNFCLASLGVTAVFLNAPLPIGHIVVLRLPTILYKINLLPPGHVWLVHKAIYGLREAPSLWSEGRTEALKRLTFASGGEIYAIFLSQVHQSLRLIVRQRSLQSHSPSIDHLGLTSRVATSRSHRHEWHLRKRLPHCWSFSCGQVISGYFKQDLENVGSTASDDVKRHS